MTRCGECGTDNDESAAVCGWCGAAMGTVRSLGAPEDPFDPPDQDGSTRRLSPAEEGAPRARRWGTAGLGRERHVRLYIDGGYRPLTVTIENQITLGRYDGETHQAPEVDLSEFGALELGVSRRHVSLILADDALKVIDLGSANATLINGHKLLPHQARLLRDGDELRLGRLVMRVQFV